MPSVGKRCHEVRIRDENKIWRLFYRIDSDAIVVILWVEKKTDKTPDEVIELCRKRLKMYDAESSGNGFHTKGYIFRKEEIYRII